MELLLGGQRLLLLFPLTQDRSSFLRDLSQRRASLEGLKMVALPRPCPHQGQHTQGRHWFIRSDEEGNFPLALLHLIVSFNLTLLLLL